MINSRDTHISLNGKKAMQGEYFPGSVLRYPGDPTAPAREVINCHCVLVPDVLLPGERLVDGEIVSADGLNNSEPRGIMNSGPGLLPEKTGHAEQRSTERKISDADIEDALENSLHVSPIKTDSQGRRSQKYIGSAATVIKNPDTGDIVTVWATSTKRREKYSKKGD